MARLIPGEDGERLGDYKTLGHYKDRQGEFYKQFDALLQQASEEKLTRKEAWQLFRTYFDPVRNHPEASEEFVASEDRFCSQLEEIIGSEPREIAQYRVRDVSWKWPLLGFVMGVLGHELNKQGVNVTALYGTGLGTIAVAHAMNVRQKRMYARRSSDQPDVDYVPLPQPKLGVGGKFVAGMIAIGALVGLMYRGLPRDQQELAKPHKARMLIEQAANGPMLLPDEVPNELYRR